MNDSGCSRRFIARVNGPRSTLFVAGGEISSQAEQVVDGPNQRVHPAVLDSEPLQVFKRLLLTQLYQFAFNLRTNDDGFGAEMRLCVFAYGIHMARCRQ